VTQVSEQAAGNDLLVMVPTRGRRAQCERLLETFTETATCADLLFIIDGDDQESYAGMDWGDAATAVLEPREYLTGKLNKTAMPMADLYDVLMWVGDDHVFKTPAWDKIMLATLADMGGSGWVYPDDKRRADVPEIWMCSSDVVKALDWFAPPSMDHFYIDNAIGELGKRAGMIRWCPQAVVEHLHYSVCAETEHDGLYKSTEDRFGDSDLKAFHEWRSSDLANEVSVLRRAFNPDLAWVLSRV
jgi:hypothetical protein